MSGPVRVPGAFVQATRVERTETQPVGNDGGGVEAGTKLHYTGEIHDGWDIGGNANGGYLMAIAGRAMADAVQRPPLTLTGHYLRPAPAGPCRIDVEVVRSGRRLATVRATLSVEAQPVLALLGTFGEQRRDDGDSYLHRGPVELVPYADCVSMPSPDEGISPALNGRLANRLQPGDDGFRLGQPNGEPVMRGYFALADDEPIDAFGLLLGADAFPPPIFNWVTEVAWVPTVELTVHIRGVPVPGPLAVEFRSRWIRDGLVDEDGELWDASGRLVAQSRQLSLAPRRP